MAGILSTLGLANTNKGSLTKLTKKPEKWFRSRGYAHFDKPIGYERASKIVKNPSTVAKHAFFPLLSYEIVSQKVKKDVDSGKLSIVKKNRDIRFASHIDSHIYSYYSYILSDFYEKKISEHNLEKSVIAFRKLEKSNINFANDAFDCIKSYYNCCVIALDITGFFDHIDHNLLKKSWSYTINSNHLPDDHFAIYKSITKYSYIDRLEIFDILGLSKNNPPKSRDGLCSSSDFRKKIRPTGIIENNKKNYGIPQGSPISAILSNIYMIDFDIKINNIVNSRAGKYFRYCDDILVIIPGLEYNELLDLIESQISDMGLTSNQKKQEISIFSHKANNSLSVISGKPMQYLGFTFDGKNKIIRSAAFARYSMKMKSGVSLAKQTARKHNKIRLINGKQTSNIYKKSLYKKYSHLGRKNFISYALKASKIMNSSAIRKQIKPLWSRLQHEIYLAENTD
ncbi:MAG: antiviral reverse transcriptase Drt2 [Moraxellaceae bacterium]|nr:antiviral reverse transcriptase Drt2 [Moraxellaceae bacterium]